MTSKPVVLLTKRMADQILGFLWGSTNDYGGPKVIEALRDMTMEASVSVPTAGRRPALDIGAAQAPGPGAPGRDARAVPLQAGEPAVTRPELEEELHRLREALDHIARVALASRMMSLRTTWIITRAISALNGDERWKACPQSKHGFSPLLQREYGGWSPPEPPSPAAHAPARPPEQSA